MSGISEAQVGGSLVLVLVASEKTAYAGRIARTFECGSLQRACQSIAYGSGIALQLTLLLDLPFFAAARAIS